VFVVDTNIFLYAANTTYDEHDRCRQLLEEWRASDHPWYSTWPNVYEFLRVATHRNVWEEPWSTSQAWGFVRSVAASPGFGFLTETERHTEVVREVLSELPELCGNILHDTHTAVLMREHGILRIYTHDADFRRFPFLEVVDPVEE
jgi:toxin-antitoxin system PIN domain toxin